ncbi:WD repeat-containing protein 64 [Eumeta japonica]|uniref:WD repeat-containing protein 64 n=1 Tax=Eumeta variegata TaxID=151549 RepID=A0A4C1WSP4_EUMVA|nr:WD repeat-containing protein 64 [Eumeta japonica]
MAYEPSESKEGTSELVWGDDRGDLTALTFLRPRLMLLHKAHADKSNTYFWTDLSSSNFEAYVRTRRWRRLVARSVRRVALCRRLSSVVVCSHDAATALLIKHRPGLLDDYVFKVVRGVSCFHICGTSRVLVTGGADGTLRLWEPARPTPLAQLTGPARTPIKDVVIISSREIVLSFNKNCTLDIWDIYEEALLQTLKLNFPFLGVLGKRVEFGAYCIYPGPPRKKYVELSHTPRGTVTSKEELMIFAGENNSDTQHAEETETPREPEYWERSSGLKDDPTLSCIMLQGRSELSNLNRMLNVYLAACAVHLNDMSYPNKKECVVTFGDNEAEAPVSPVPTPARSQHALLPPELASVSPCVCADFTEMQTNGKPPQNRQLPPSMDTRNLRVVKVDTEESQKNQENPSESRSKEAKAVLPRESPKRRCEHLDELLQKAGLESILDKDFVLMKGLKHDLNQKLFRMQELSEQMKTAVTLRAPHLGLRLHDVDPLPLPPDVGEACRRVLR